MKEYVNLMHTIIDKVELWENYNLNEKTNFFCKYIDAGKESAYFISYLEKYAYYLSKKTFNYFTKDVISLKF